MRVHVENVSFEYSSGFELRDISLEVPAGAFLALIGPNGSGKTTLLRLMTGALQPTRGRILLAERSLEDFSPRELARNLAVISSEQYFEFPFPVEEVVAMGRFPHLGRLQRMSQEDQRIVDEAIRLTQVEPFRRRPISHLSSGERQRVLIARAIAQSPTVLMLDEPNAHLDIHHQLAIFRLLRLLNREHRLTVVVVLHDLTAAAAFCRTVALLSRGRLISVGTPEEVITTETIRRVYGAEVTVHPSPIGGFPQISYPRDR